MDDYLIIQPGKLSAPFNLAFSDDGKEVGRLEMKGGELTFTGSADKSARMFFNAFKDIIDAYVAGEVRKATDFVVEDLNTMDGL